MYTFSKAEFNLVTKSVGDSVDHFYCKHRKLSPKSINWHDGVTDVADTDGYVIQDLIFMPIVVFWNIYNLFHIATVEYWVFG